ncbi:hypothetical protein KEM52_000286, partial [Ascosphaera acerosa]
AALVGADPETRRPSLMNRKERRAARSSGPGSNGSSVDPMPELSDVSQIPLAKPPAASQRTPNGKTLIELAAEREAALRAQSQGASASASTRARARARDPVDTEFVKVDENGNIVRGDGTTLAPETPGDAPAIEEEMPPLPDTILYSFPLSAMHLILSYVAMLQYAEDVDYPALFIRSGLVVFPILTLVIHFAHGHIVSFEPLKALYKRKPAKGKGRMFKPGEKFQQAEPTRAQRVWRASAVALRAFFPLTPQTFVYLPLAIGFGAKLIQTTNEKFYYANMRTAPSLGTLWVWAVIELGFGPAVLAFIVPVCWAKYHKGYALW